MQIFHFRTGPVSVNTYIVYDENTKDGFIIDPGGNYKRINKELAEKGITLKAQLLTHGHFDHCGASAALQKDGIPVYIHEFDALKTYSQGNLSEMFGVPFQTFRADRTLHDGEVFSVAGIKIRVLLTPGHTSGSVCYIIGENIFSGDTLFNMSIGRTDFPDGNEKELFKSIKEKLFTIEGDYTLYPGHDDPSTLDYERNYNPMVEW